MSEGLGARGERLAAVHLADLGYRVLDRNWRAVPSRDGLRGELDVVAEHDGRLVAVEVKTRSSHRFGHPFESITREKTVRLHRLAAAWARAHQRDPGVVRVDAVAITFAHGGVPEIEVLQRIE